jgi:hypothetical protein
VARLRLGLARSSTKTVPSSSSAPVSVFCFISSSPFRLVSCDPLLVHVIGIHSHASPYYLSTRSNHYISGGTLPLIPSTTLPSTPVLCRPCIPARSIIAVASPSSDTVSSWQSEYQFLSVSTNRIENMQASTYSSPIRRRPSAVYQPIKKIQPSYPS